MLLINLYFRSHESLFQFVMKFEVKKIQTTPELSKDQILTVLSTEPLPSLLPVQFQATECTLSLCPIKGLDVKVGNILRAESKLNDDLCICVFIPLIVCGVAILSFPFGF